MPAETEPRAEYLEWMRGPSFDISGLFERMHSAALGATQHMFYIDSMGGSFDDTIRRGQRAGKSRYVQERTLEHLRSLYGTSVAAQGRGFCSICLDESARIAQEKLDEVLDRSKPSCLFQIQETLLPGHIPVLGRPRLHSWLAEAAQPSPLLRETSLKEKAAIMQGDVHISTFGTFRTGLESVNEYLYDSFHGNDRISELDRLVAQYQGHDGSYKRQKHEARKLA